MKWLRFIFLFNIFVLQIHASVFDSPYFYHGKILSEQERSFYLSIPHRNVSGIFGYVRSTLPRFLKDCLLNKCVSGEHLILAKKIDRLMEVNLESGLLQFANSKGEFPKIFFEFEREMLIKHGFYNNPKLFYDNQTSAMRIAVSSIGPGPIVINTDLAKDIDLIDAFKIFLHEFGHQLGMRDDTHRQLDLFANAFSDFLKLKTIKKAHKNFKLYNHFLYFPKQNSPLNYNFPAFGKNDLLTHLYPHLILQDGSETYFLHTYLQKVIMKQRGKLYTSEVWLGGLSLVQKGDRLVIKGKLGQRLNTMNQSEKLDLEGDLEIIIPLEVGASNQIDSTKNITVTYKNLYYLK